MGSHLPEIRWVSCCEKSAFTRAGFLVWLAADITPTPFIVAMVRRLWRCVRWHEQATQEERASGTMEKPNRLDQKLYRDHPIHLQAWEPTQRRHPRGKQEAHIQESADVTMPPLNSAITGERSAASVHAYSVRIDTIAMLMAAISWLTD
jgi:hypothetical protein